MENTELTQEEQEKAYEEEYNKAFYGDNTPDTLDDVEETAEAEEVEDEPEQDEKAEDDVETEAVADDETETADIPGDSDDDSGADDSDVDSGTPDADEPDDVEEELETITWKGQEVKVTKAEKTALAQKGFDYTAKTQEVAKIIKENKYLSQFDQRELEALARAKSGDKEALAYLIQSSGVDTVDLLDVEPSNIALHNSEPEVLISSQVAPLIEQVQSNPEEFASMQDAISKLPTSVTNVMQQDPEWFKTVHTEVMNGNFNQVIPKVQLKLSQMSDFDRTYYETNPQAFASLYSDVLGGGVSQPKAEVPAPVRKEVKKPNMAEVGIKRNGGTERRAEVKADAFTDDKVFQATLARMRRTIG